MTSLQTKTSVLSENAISTVKGATTNFLRVLYLVVGCIFTGLAIWGSYTPLVPTVPFALVAAWCFKRSSPRLHARLRNLKFVGPMLTDWEDHKRISPKAKKWAMVSIVISFSISIYAVNTLMVKVFLGCLAIVISTFILTRKSK